MQRKDQHFEIFCKVNNEESPNSLSKPKFVIDFRSTQERDDDERKSQKTNNEQTHAVVHTTGPQTVFFDDETEMRVAT